MKEAIYKLSNLTREQIRNTTLDDTTSTLEEFNSLNGAASEIWQLFKLFDTDTRDVRTMDLINNHASGIVIKQAERLKALSKPLFVAEPLVKENALPDLEKYKEMASFYLEYKKHESQLKDNQSILEEHIEVLQSSTCKMQ